MLPELRSDSPICSARRVSIRRFDYLGHQFNEFTVVQYVGNGHWLCECSCGGFSRIGTAKITNESIVKCKKCADKDLSNAPLIGDMPRRFWQVLTRGASRRGIAVNITPKDVWQLYLSQERRCSLTGWPLVFAHNGKDHDRGLTTVSVDRIDSQADYTVDNIHIVHKDVNKLKERLELAYFIELCHSIASFDGNFQNLPIYTSSFTSKNKRRRGCGELLGSYFSRCVVGASRCNKPFMVDVAYAWNQFLVQRGHCYLTGWPLIMATTTRELWDGYQTASFGEIDCELGFVADNCVWFHKDVNTAKMDMSLSRIKTISLAVATHRSCQ